MRMKRVIFMGLIDLKRFDGAYSIIEEELNNEQNTIVTSIDCLEDEGLDKMVIQEMVDYIENFLDLEEMPNDEIKEMKLIISI